MSIERRTDDEEQSLLDNKSGVRQTVYSTSSQSNGQEEDVLVKVDTTQDWNNPPENMGKTLVTFLGFVNMGIADAALGALLPSFQAYYKLSDVRMSLALLAPVGGYLISALINTPAHYTLGRGGLSILGTSLQLLMLIIASTGPHYYLLLLGFAAYGLGAGLCNGSWNAWVGAFKSSHGVLGLLQGSYAVGGVLGPALVTLILEKNQPWYMFYFVVAISELIVVALCILTFRKDGPSTYKSEVNEGEEDLSDASTWDALKNRKVILLSILLYAYNGTEMSLSDWVPTYMIRERHGDPKLMGLMTSCLWFGLTSGRIVLGFFTGRFQNQHRVVLTYLVSAIFLQLIFWLVRGSMFVSAASILAIGFFTGPMYPSAMIIATTILPKRLHVPGICAASALSSVGAATLPVSIGFLVETFGAWILQPVLFFFLIFLTLLWLALPSRR